MSNILDKPILTENPYADPISLFDAALDTI